MGFDKYGTWFRPMRPRLCKCGYNGYFRLKEIEEPTPNCPFMEICPKCGCQREIKENDRIEAYLHVLDKLVKFAELAGRTVQELYDETFRNVILQFDPKNRKVRLVRKDTGETVLEG